MIVLGIDTATAATAVAVQAPGQPARELRDDPAPGAHPGHATRLLALAEELLVASGAAWGDVGRVAVGVGPGAFTGLRVGIATARGLAQALDAGLVGVSSLAALAAEALSPAADGTGRVLAVIDARRGEVFGEGGVVCRPEELDVAGKLLVGDGAVRYRALFEAAGATIPPDGDGVHRPDPYALAEHAGPFGPVEDVDPLYLRAPDAKPVRP